ncbi:MAG TPA: ankyrin repeat domain-containing protein [Thermodesulfobacteriota bacterium]|nr:ankyrin repeat domain-containing protein [Thermodesulfobacteriota bacterium]
MLYACIVFVLLITITGCATPLMNAAGKGDIKEAEKLLSSGADVNERWFDNYTPLHFAAFYASQPNVAALLIEKGADVNAKDNYGRTPLYVAAWKGQVNFVTMLLKKGADPGIATNEGKTPLRIAQDSGHTTIAKILSEAEKKFLEGNEGTAATYLPKPVAKETAIIDIHTIPDFKAIPRQNDIAVVIGIENYQGIPKSDYSKSDAGVVKDYLKALGFQERNIELLTDERATFSGITKTIEAWLPNRVKKESKVFIYYSGHGAPEPNTGDAYMVPFDGDPNYLSVTGYSLKRLYENLGKLQVEEVVVLLDSCFSGAGGRSVLAKGARPLVMVTDVSVISSNMAVLSATQGTQISTSSSEKGHGVFTYYFLKALKDGKKDIAEIYSYIKPFVEDEAKQLNVQQSPSINPDVEKLKGRFGLRR